MVPHSSTLAWKIPWMEKPDGLQSMGSLRVGHNWATSLSWIGEGNGNPFQYSCLENPRDGGAWCASIYGVSQSQTQLKWLSCSSSIPSIRVFPNESALHIKWPKHWSFSIILPMNILGWCPLGFNLPAVQGNLKSLLQHHNLKASFLQCSALFMVQFSQPYMTTGKIITLMVWSFVGKMMSLLF